MPVIRVEVPECTYQDTRISVREGVKQAVLDTLAPKEINCDYVAVREVFGILGGGLPLVTVDLRLGRDAGCKMALTDAIAAILENEQNSGPVDLYA
ncbi:MAG: hypothetical protein OXH76_00100 [Boseongicola sp.]|nr:hypothetical protein [Boseongicola sp.]